MYFKSLSLGKGLLLIKIKGNKDIDPKQNLKKIKLSKERYSPTNIAFVQAIHHEIIAKDIQK